MDEEDYEKCEEWFDKYVERYRTQADPTIQGMVELKIRHTKRTVEHAKAICKGEGITGAKRNLAVTATLLHDTGRFEQATKHRTHKDQDSTDHGALGAAILEEEGALDHLPTGEREAILEAVKHHNKKTLPRMDEEALTTSKVVRDADKLDNMHLQATKDAPREACTPAVIKELIAGELVNNEHVTTTCDHTLLVLNWLDHLNHETSRRIAREARYAERLLNKLPATPDADKVRHALQDKTL